jgi:hypothetical protein
MPASARRAQAVRQQHDAPLGRRHGGHFGGRCPQRGGQVGQAMAAQCKQPADSQFRRLSSAGRLQYRHRAGKCERTGI